MGKHTITEIGTKGLGWYEHPALHHQLGHSDAAQERRLAASVSTSDHHQYLAITAGIVANDSILNAANSTDIVQPPTGEHCLAEREGLGHADRLTLSGDLVAQVHATVLSSLGYAEQIRESASHFQDSPFELGQILSLASLRSPLP